MSALFAHDQTSPSLSCDSSGTAERAIEIWTANGFFLSALPGFSGAPSNDYRFHVRHASSGTVGDVTVTIDPTVMDWVAQEIGRRLLPTDPFWRLCAERAMVYHMVRYAALPPAHRLLIDDVTDRCLHVARTWPDGSWIRET